MKNNFEIHINLKNSTVDINAELLESKYGLKFENEKMFFFLSGKIFNQNELLNKLNLQTFADLIQKLYEIKRDQFTKEFTGEYCGFLYDKLAKKIIVFTNVTGSFPVFYYKSNIDIFFNTNMLNLITKIKAFNISYSLDVTAAYTILTFIGLMEDQTLVSEIKKLCSAEQISVNILENKLTSEKVGDVDNTETFRGRKKDALAQMDFLFKKAVKQEYDADINNNSKHFTLLSGGLDSRMNLMYAYKLGYDIDKAVCYTHSNYWDEKIAEKITNDLKIPFQVVYLDGGDFLKIIDPLLDDLNYSADYRIAAQSNYALKNSYENHHGIVHSGILGDGVIGSYMGSTEHEPPIKGLSKLIHNQLFLPKINIFFSQLLSGYENREMFLLKNRGFSNLVGGALVTQQFSLQASPFTNRDFMQFVLRLPPEWKFKQKIYIEWINEYCPESTNYMWERTLLKPNAVWKTTFGDNVTYKLFSHFYRKVLFQGHKISMAPYDYYFETNESIKTYFDKYFWDNIEFISGYPELQGDLIKIYKEGKFRDKTRVLSLLGSYRKLFI